MTCDITTKKTENKNSGILYINYFNILNYDSC